MSYKQRPKNKQSMSDKSGTGRKKALPRKLIVEFEFIHDEKKYKLGTGRIKVSEEGGITLLVRDNERKWKNVRGELISIKLKSVVIKKESKKK